MATKKTAPISHHPHRKGSRARYQCKSRGGIMCCCRSITTLFSGCIALCFAVGHGRVTGQEAVSEITWDNVASGAHTVSVGGRNVAFQVWSDHYRGQHQRPWGNQFVEGSTDFRFLGSAAYLGVVRADFYDEISGGNVGAHTWRETERNLNLNHTLGGFLRWHMAVTDSPGSPIKLRFVWKLLPRIGLHAFWTANGDDVERVEAQLHVATRSDCAEGLPELEVDIGAQTIRTISHGVNAKVGVEAGGEGTKVGGGLGYEFSSARQPAASFDVPVRTKRMVLYCDYCVGHDESRFFDTWTEVLFYKLLLEGENPLEPEKFAEFQRAIVKTTESFVDVQLIRIEVCLDEAGDEVPPYPLPGNGLVAKCPRVSDSEHRRVNRELGLVSDEVSVREALFSFEGSPFVTLNATRVVDLDFDDVVDWTEDVALSVETTPGGIIDSPSTLVLARGEDTAQLSLSAVAAGTAVVRVQWTDPLTEEIETVEQEFEVVRQDFDVHVLSPQSSSRLAQYPATALVGDSLTVNVYALREFQTLPDLSLALGVPGLLEEVGGSSFGGGASGLIASFALRAVEPGTTDLIVSAGASRLRREIQVEQVALEGMLWVEGIQGRFVVPGQDITYNGWLRNSGSTAVRDVFVRNQAPTNSTFRPESNSGIRFVGPDVTGRAFLELDIPELPPETMQVFRYTVRVNDLQELDPNFRFVANQFSATMAVSEAILEPGTVTFFSGPQFETEAPTLLEIAVPFARGDINVDRELDISDASKLFGILFLGEADIDCEEAKDANDDGAVDISDGISILSFLFLGGPPPAVPNEGCGADPEESPINLGCQSFPICE